MKEVCTPIHCFLQLGDPSISEQHQHKKSQQFFQDPLLELLILSASHQVFFSYVCVRVCICVCMHVHNRCWLKNFNFTIYGTLETNSFTSITVTSFAFFSHQGWLFMSFTFTELISILRSPWPLWELTQIMYDSSPSYPQNTLKNF